MKLLYRICTRSLHSFTTAGLFLLSLIGATPMAGILSAGTALAQDYPSRPIRLIVPFPPGNFSDSGARLAAQRLSDQIGQPIVVENRAGAADMIGTEVAARGAGRVHPGPRYKLRILAVTSRERLPALADVPTTAEAGMPELNVTAWMGLLAPVGVPAEAVRRIDTEMRKALGTKQMISALAKMGAMPAPAGPRQFAELIAREFDSYAEIVRRAGIQPE